MFLCICIVMLRLFAFAGAGVGGGDDGFFFFSAASGITADRVASVMQGRMQNLFGKDFTVKPFLENQVRPIKNDKELNCTFTNRTCRWHNVFNDAGPSYIKDVYVAGGKANSSGKALAKNLLFGTDSYPKGSFGILPSQQQNVSRHFFCSDPVPFSQPKPGAQGIVTLKSWCMPNSNVKACIRIWDPLNKNNDKTSSARKWPLNWLGCSEEIGYLENAGPNQLKINLSDSYKSMQSLAKKHRKPTSLVGVTYEVCLLMGPFPNARGGMMFIDDISYNSSG